MPPSDPASRPKRTHPVLARLRKLSASYPESSEVEAWEHPTFRVGKKIFATFGLDAGEPSVSCKQTHADQSVLVENPAFRVADYVGKHGWITIDASQVEWPVIAELVDRSYRLIANKRQLKALDGE